MGCGYLLERTFLEHNAWGAGGTEEGWACGGQLKHVAHL